MANETIPNATNGTHEAMATISQKHLERMEKLEEGASESSTKMFEVLTLIHAIFDLNNSPDAGGLSDAPGLTDKISRMDSLLIMARDRAAAAIEALPV